MPGHYLEELQAFAANPSAGVVRIDGQMIDKPHERAVRAIMAAARDV